MVWCLVALIRTHHAVHAMHSAQFYTVHDSGLPTLCTCLRCVCLPSTAPSAAPCSFTLDNSSTISVGLSWSPVDPYKLNGRLVQYIVKALNLNGSIVAIVGTKSTSATLTGLIFATVYNMSVAAESTGGNSSLAKYLQVTTSQDGNMNTHSSYSLQDSEQISDSSPPSSTCKG